MNMLKFGSKIFDSIFSDLNRNKIESFTIWSASIGFIIHLSLVLLNNYSIIDIGNESLLLTNPISAIYTPFSIILYYEIFLLIYYLPRSFTTSILKQFEIISLIVIRRIFYDIPKLDLESSNWLQNPDNLQITYDLICILILFFLIYLFNLGKSRIENKKGKKNINKLINADDEQDIHDLLEKMIYEEMVNDNEMPLQPPRLKRQTAQTTYDLDEGYRCSDFESDESDDEDEE